MTVHGDATVCVGAGQCALRAPAVFDQDDEDGTVVILDPEPDTEHDDAVHEAVALCPSGAISITGLHPRSSRPDPSRR